MLEKFCENIPQKTTKLITYSYFYIKLTLVVKTMVSGFFEVFDTKKAFVGIVYIQKP